MQHIEKEFKGCDGTAIYYQAWIPDKPKAVIQLVHGFAEHSGRYGNVVNEIVPLGFAIYADDHRGHGKTQGQRNYVDYFDQFVEDEKIFYDLIKNEHPNLPIIMLGHSMGSVIGIRFASKYPDLLKGLIISGSGTEVGGEVTSFLKFLAKVMSKLAPKLMVAQGDLSKYLSHDPAVVNAYNTDPLVYAKKCSARLGWEFIVALSENPAILEKLTLPILFMRGAEDILLKNGEALGKSVKSPDATIKNYEGLYHEIFNESEAQRKIVLKDLADWLQAHV